MVINVIDSPCGTGKTEWAIRYMNEHSEEYRFLYVTPYLTEIDRVRNSVDFRMVTPKEGSKRKNLLSLIEKGEHIAITHVLLSIVDNRFIDLIEAQGYVLILDEVLTVLSPLQLGAGDIKLLLSEGLIEVDKSGTVSITEVGRQYTEMKIKYSTEFDVIDTGNVLMFNNRMMVWEFPSKALGSFKDVYILTYMFKGQTMCNYIKATGHTLSFYYIDEYVLKEGRREYTGSPYRDLINVYEGHLNSIGDKEYSLSSAWVMSNKNYRLRRMLARHTVNYFKNIVKSISGQSIWTCKLNGNGDPILTVPNYIKAFVPMTSRATNIYRERSNCAYLVNRYENPIIKNYFNSHGLEIDEDLFALSELIQWLFRGAIRDRKKINLYIPSKRMRKLLKDWLNK